MEKIATFLRTNKFLVLSILLLLAAVTLIALNLNEIAFDPTDFAKFSLAIATVGLILMSIAFAVMGYFSRSTVSSHWASITTAVVGAALLIFAAYSIVTYNS